MTYSIIGILAAIILLISNRDLLWRSRDLTQTQKNYCCFLVGVMAYYITDLLWGLLESNGLTAACYVDTVIHFAAMASSSEAFMRSKIAFSAS